ncbi:MAG TPA: isoamylase early set domain-containing protein, partial [Sedimentisphaerales bacterium]|nr:isoamylase early set domain-containing protein [Sedimentisphaerales bacterium]
KKYTKTKPVCKVTFCLTKDAAKGAGTAAVVGDFNGWNNTATPMKRDKSGNFKVTLELEKDREYQFRYLLDGKTWENDWEADKYVMAGVGNAENSVVVV